MRVKGIATAAAVALALSAPGAWAQTISQQGSDIFGGVGAETVSITSPADTRTVNAGAFRLAEGARNFLAWCVDAVTEISLPSTYTQAAEPFDNDPLFSPDVVPNILRLFNTAYAGLDVTDTVQAAGFQVALWELIYDGPDGPFNLGAGEFRLNNNQAVRDAADGFLAGLDGYDTGNYALTFWEAPTNTSGSKRLSQNLIEATVIPLPAGVWMLLAALGALVAVRRARGTA